VSEWLRPTSASFFSGVGGMDYGLERAGWFTTSFSEIDKYASAVLASRFPGVANLGSMTDWRDWPDGEWQDAYLWAGGPPCQDFSVAGKRAGLAGSRSGLALTWFNAVERYRPRAIILENVPGILSSNSGRDLRALTARLEGLGYQWAYRTLNARWFGVPQRRRRVFLVAVHARTGLGARDAGAVLAVGHRCERHPHARLAPGERATAAAQERIGVDVVGALPAGTHGFPDGVQEFMQGHFVPVVQGPTWYDDGTTPTLRSGGRHQGSGSSTDNTPVVATYVKRHRAASVEDAETWAADEEAPTLNGNDASSARATVAVVSPVAATLNSNKSGGWRYDPDQAENLVGTELGVRRLTPLECERLQGWPDGWTIPAEWRGKRHDGSDLLPAGLDSPRYRCIGNGVAAPVATWVGGRLLSAMSAVWQTEGAA
jgi:DNA (cytosine-5)-methyltransferase 1